MSNAGHWRHCARRRPKRRRSGPPSNGRLRRRRPAAQPGSLGPASGSVSNVACPGGGSITVDSSLAPNLSSLLGAASAAGLNMCGGGYRDPAQQIALRRAHCGSSDYAIYQAPSSACSPPTARPGTSMHEKGLAIDFTCGGGTISRGSACFGWLDGNAAGYGLVQPAERALALVGQRPVAAG